MLSKNSDFYQLVHTRAVGDLALLQAWESGRMRGLQMCQIVGWKFLGHIVQLVLLFESLSLVCHSLAWSSQRMVANVSICVRAGLPKPRGVPDTERTKGTKTLDYASTPLDANTLLCCVALIVLY